MIPISLQLEPDNFDRNVRQKGAKWLQENTIFSELPSYWQKCLDDLYIAYDGVCAYYAIKIDEISGHRTVDHFKPKAKYPHLAYEWDNYRFACGSANSKKRDFEDVLDPFSLPDNLFYIHFGTGEVLINPQMDNEITQNAERTINRLSLNDNRLKNRRKKDFLRYYQEKSISLDELKQQNPFVWAEILRQDLVRND